MHITNALNVKIEKLAYLKTFFLLIQKKTSGNEKETFQIAFY